MTARVALLSAVLLLVLVAPASAKELARVAVCGADGCVDRTERATHGLAEGGPFTEPVRRPEPYYFIRVGYGEGDTRRVVHRVTLRWFPRSGALQGADGVWIRARPRVVRALRRVTRGIEPRADGKLPPAPSEGPGGQLPPRVVAPPAQRAAGDGPSGALIAAPAGVLLGLVALGAHRRRRRHHP